MANGRARLVQARAEGAGAGRAGARHAARQAPVLIAAVWSTAAWEAWPLLSEALEQHWDFSYRRNGTRLRSPGHQIPGHGGLRSNFSKQWKASAFPLRGRWGLLHCTKEGRLAPRQWESPGPSPGLRHKQRPRAHTGLHRPCFAQAWRKASAFS